VVQEPQKKSTEEAPLRELAKRYRDFPLYRAPQVFINAASQSLPVLMLASFFGPSSAGFYTLGRTVLNIPSILISTSVGEVFYPRVSEAAHKGENLTRLILKSTVALVAVGFVPFALVIVFGPWLFDFAFGAKWVRAGEYARWSAFWMFFMFVNTPSIKAIPILSAQLFHLIFTMFTITTRLAVLLIGYHIYENDLVAVALFGISGAVINIILILLILLKSYQYDKNLELR
jgi:O-antigen/teichoic acid export membrane protein